MSNLSPATACDEAVRDFARQLARTGATPDRLVVKLDGHDGMAGLCAAEAALAELWPNQTAKELVWLTRSAQAVEEVLSLSAYRADGGLLGEARFALSRRRQAA